MDNRLKILNYLARHQEKSFTMHELSKELVIPYASFHRTINSMKPLIKEQKIGKARTIGINKDNPILDSYLTISSEEQKEEYLNKNPIIKNIAKDIKIKDIILLFGSYASNKQTEKSDIDLLIINDRGKKSISFAKYELLFNKKINPIFITKKEFNLMLKEKEENVGKQALKNHIILNNPKEFWEQVIDDV